MSDLGAAPEDIDALTTDALRDMIILNTPRYPSREKCEGCTSSPCDRVDETTPGLDR